MGNLPVTLGLEFESVVASKEDMGTYINCDPSIKKYLKQITRDASVESTFMSIKNSSCKLFIGDKWIRNHITNSGVTIGGYETITVPLELNLMRDVIKRITAIEELRGEIFSNRSSIHVHTGYPSGFIFLKTAVALGLAVEPLLFKIAGMTRPYRGMENDSAYCRPLSIPPAVKLTDSKQYAVLDPVGSLDSTSPSDFWGKYGISADNRERYNPLRYFCINAFSILLRGTLEYRFFNFSTSASHIEAVASLCRFISDLMLRVPLSVIKDINVLDICEAHSDSEYIFILNRLVKLGGHYNSELRIEKRDYLKILELIEKTPQPVFKNEFILSHIRDPILSRGQAIENGLKLIDSARFPNIVDIHNFSDSNRKLGE
jgi:hypothetical protein